MRRALVALLVGSLVQVGCTRNGGIRPTHTPVTPTPSVVIRVGKPAEITIGFDGYQMVVQQHTYPAANLWAHGVVESAGAVCAHLKPPGFSYTFSDASDAGATMSITCSNDSHHIVHVIFVPEST